MSTRFDLYWRYAGREGTILGVNASWREETALFGGGSQVREAAISEHLPIDLPALARRTHPNTGYAELQIGGSALIAGRWTDVTYDPASPAGRTLVSFTISESIDEDVGVWPLSGSPTSQPSPNDVADYRDFRDEVYGKALSYFDLRDREPIPILYKDRFPDLAKVAEGKMMPYVIGKAGVDRSTNGVPAVPAWVVVADSARPASKGTFGT